METNKYFSTRLRQLREAKGITQKELGAVFGSQKSVISNWEARQSIPRAHILSQLADSFDVSIDYLLGRTDNPETN